MRILITVDPVIPVPPLLYGGIERIVDFVARGLHQRGHEIFLMAHPESKTAGTLVPYGAPPHWGTGPRCTELWQVGSELWHRRNRLDVILSWGRLAALVPVLPVRGLAKIQRYCRDQVPWKSVRKAVALAGNSIRFSAPSDSVYREHERFGVSGGRWRTIYDGVETEKYRFVPAVAPDAPLAFLGVLHPRKGAHLAIAIARACGRKLVIAGKQVEEPEHAGYFAREIAPHLGEQVEFIGPVDDEGKNKLLGSAAALLFPTDYEEAFGIVMAEAMACGTPVIGFARGAVPEVIRDGTTGFVCRTAEEAIVAVSRLGGINRSEVRKDCERRFDARILVDQYEGLCRESVAGCRGEPRRRSQPS